MKYFITHLADESPKALRSTAQIKAKPQRAFSQRAESRLAQAIYFLLH